MEYREWPADIYIHPWLCLASSSGAMLSIAAMVDVPAYYCITRYHHAAPGSSLSPIDDSYLVISSDFSPSINQRGITDSFWCP
jgi:hypothetical protein